MEAHNEGRTTESTIPTKRVSQEAKLIHFIYYEGPSATCDFVLNNQSLYQPSMLIDNQCTEV